MILITMMIRVFFFVLGNKFSSAFTLRTIREGICCSSSSSSISSSKSDKRIIYAPPGSELASFSNFSYDEEDDDLLYSEAPEVSFESTKMHDIYWLDDTHKDTKSLGDAIGQGEAVVCIPAITSEEECLELFAAGVSASGGRIGAAQNGRSRLSVSDPNAFSPDVVMNCDEILLRVLDHIDENIPSVYDTLFKPSETWISKQPLNAQLEQPTTPPPIYISGTCESLRELYLMGQLEWSEGEPAINVYEDTGYFGAHKDHLALTVLIPLTSPDHDFLGGGTGFWQGNRMVDEDMRGEEPTTVLKPMAGSALLFGGDVTHAGMPVEGGYRSVFVCSFSTRTDASPENRLHGLQAPPEVTPGFKGSL